MALRAWVQSLRARAASGVRPVPDSLWHATLAAYPFLRERSQDHLERLRQLSAEFLHTKQFHGAGGLDITDEMALMIAAQACLPILGLTHRGKPLDWYSDFVGIVVYPGEMLARREVTDEHGVVHQYREILAGEAMQDGPVALSWHDVASSGASADDGYNVVIHEFAHKIDMRDGAADGCPPLWPGFLGSPTASGARALWQQTMQTAYQAFREQVIIAERFSGPAPWMDPYAAESVDEFFAVACEAFFVNPLRFRSEFASLAPLFDAFFNAAIPPS